MTTCDAFATLCSVEQGGGAAAQLAPYDDDVLLLLTFFFLFFSLKVLSLYCPLSASPLHHAHTRTEEEALLFASIKS